MTKRNGLQPGRRIILSLVATIAALCLMLTTSLNTLASTVRISDPVGVLSVNQVMSEGAKLSYPLDVYTTNTFNGTASDFVQRTISVHLTSTKLIVIAIDITHRYFAIVGGSQVPLSKTQYTSAGTAFKNAVKGNHFTDAVIAAIQSLESSLGIGSSKGGSISGFGLVLIIGGIVALILITAIVRFIKRLFGFGGRSSDQPVQTSTQNQPGYYGDGRDNFGGGVAGDF